jgi:hypothetical protein
MRVRDVCHGSQVAPRATVMQQKTKRPVQFEITPGEPARRSSCGWSALAFGLRTSSFQAGFTNRRIFLLGNTQG